MQSRLRITLEAVEVAWASPLLSPVLTSQTPCRVPGDAADSERKCAGDHRQIGVYLTTARAADFAAQHAPDSCSSHYGHAGR